MACVVPSRLAAPARPCGPRCPAGRLALGAGAPARDEFAREGRIGEVDRDRITQNATGAAGRESPTVGAAICVQPIANLGLPLSETARRNAYPNADREEALGCGDHLSRVARHPRILHILHAKNATRSSWCPPAWACWAVALCFSHLSSHGSEIKLVSPIKAHRPTQVRGGLESCPDGPAPSIVFGTRI